MSSFVSLGIVLLSSLGLASLQLPLGTLLLLYHASLGHNVKPRTRRLSSSFISGVVLMSFLILSSMCYLVSALTFSGSFSVVSLSVLFGILLALTLLAWFFYYKRRRSTELWVPRSVAKFLDTRAKLTSDISEAFSLGLLTTLSELLFSGVFYLLAANFILLLDPLYQVLALVLVILLSALPLLVLRILVRTGRTLADVQRWRLKNKTFFRVFTGLCYLVLAVFLLSFAILGGLNV